MRKRDRESLDSQESQKETESESETKRGREEERERERALVLAVTILANVILFRNRRSKSLSRFLFFGNVKQIDRYFGV